MLLSKKLGQNILDFIVHHLMGCLRGHPGTPWCYVRQQVEKQQVEKHKVECQKRRMDNRSNG